MEVDDGEDTSHMQMDLGHPQKSDFNTTLDQYTSEKGERCIPNVVLLAADRNEYEHGNDSIARDPSRAYTKDTISAIHSMTKLVTAIAALQCVERGLLFLDEDISQLAPEWKDAVIIEGYKKEPILRKAKTAITLRMLLSHSSGMGYEYGSADLKRWMKANGLSFREGVLAVAPLLFEPGESWAYGPGSDWAGILVERVTGMRLNEWMKQHIFEPLGLTNITFRLDEAIASGKPVADLTVKTKSKLVRKDGSIPSWSLEFDYGGGGLYSSASDYLQILISLLRDDGKLLRPATAALLFEPQLENTAALQADMGKPQKGARLERVPATMKFNHGLGGLVNLEPFPSGRAKHSLEWSGMANQSWWIDREKGVCACIFEQLLPFGDPASSDLATEFEAHIYQAVNRA